MISFVKITEDRKKAASLIRDCIYSGYLVREALKRWPTQNDDPTLLCARHALIHYAADDTKFINNKEYRKEQIEWLEQLIDILSDGEAIPKNIIESYEEYYVIPESIKFKVLSILIKIGTPFLKFYNSIKKI